MSVFLKIKDTFNKALKKGVECDSVHLTDEDYLDFCSDFKMENISEITINNIKLTITKIKDRESSFLSTAQPRKIKKNTKSKKEKEKSEENKFYIKTK
jgi:hypothetical protein